MGEIITGQSKQPVRLGADTSVGGLDLGWREDLRFSLYGDFKDNGRTLAWPPSDLQLAAQQRGPLSHPK